MQSRARVYPRGSPRLRHIFFRGTCQEPVFMFVFLTLTIPRSFYFAGYEILTGLPNYWAHSFLGGVIPIWVSHSAAESVQLHTGEKLHRCNYSGYRIWFGATPNQTILNLHAN